MHFHRIQQHILTTEANLNKKKRVTHARLYDYFIALNCARKYGATEFHQIPIKK